MATKLTKKQTKAVLADAKKLRARDKAKAAERGKKLTLSKNFKPTVPARTPPKDTSKRPSSRAYANNRNVIDSLVEPEKVAINNPSTMSSNRSSQQEAFKNAKTGVSETYKLDTKGNKIPISQEEFKKAAQKFVNAERKIPKGTSLNQVKAVKLAGKEKAISDIAKVASKGLENLSAAERKMAREGNAPARAPATPPTPKPAAPAVTEAPKAPATSAASKMTRAERSAANKAAHAVTRAAEEKKWAEQKAAKKGGAPKTTAKPKATVAKPAAPAKAAPASTAKKTTTAKPAAPKKTTATPVSKPAAKPAVTKKTTAKPVTKKTVTTKAPSAKAAPASSPAAPVTPAAPTPPKASIGSKLKAYGKSVFSPKSIISEVGGSFAADAIRGDGKSSARNIAATVVDDATTGYAVGKGYGALVGAAVGLVRGAQAEGKRTGKAPLALPSTPKQGGTFGGPKPAVGGSKGPSTRGGARGAKPATSSAPATKPKASTAAKSKPSSPKPSAPKAAPAASKAPAVAPMTANPEKAIADFEAKLRSAGVVSIAGGAGGKAQMVQQPMSVTQLEDQFKRKKGPR